MAASKPPAHSLRVRLATTYPRCSPTAIRLWLPACTVLQTHIQNSTARVRDIDDSRFRGEDDNRVPSGCI